MTSGYVNHIDISDDIILKLQFIFIEKIFLSKRKRYKLFLISKADFYGLL